MKKRMAVAACLPKPKAFAGGRQVAVAIMLLLGGQLFSQKLSDTTLVVSSGKPQVGDAFRINDKPRTEDSIIAQPKFSYGINSKKINTTFNVEPIKPARIEKEPLVKLYKTQMKLGFGNYTTPIIEVYSNNLRSKESSYGFFYRHRSSTGIPGYNSAFSNNEAEVYGKKFLRYHTLSGGLNYNSEMMHYYGNTVASTSEDSIKQRYSNIGFHASLESHYPDTVRIGHKIDLGFDHLGDLFGTTESNLVLNGNLTKYYESQRINLDLGVDDYNAKSKADTSTDAIVHFSPSLVAQGTRWNTSLGVAVVADAAVKTKYYFYPNISFSFDVVDNILTPYGGVGGGLSRNSYRALTRENPFVEPTALLQNTDKKYELYGGLRGSLTSSMAYNARVSYSKVNNMHFFITDYTEPLANRFAVVYDTATVLSLHGEIQYQHGEKLRMLASADYNQFTLSHELRPWHTPQYRVALSVNYNLQDKIVAKADVFLLGRQWALQRVGDNAADVLLPVELDGLVDASLGLEYRWNKKISLFLNFNNLAASRYQRWYNYPAQRFNFLGGLTYAF